MALRGRFLGSGDATSRRGGCGADVGGGPLWPPAGGRAHSPQARRAATRAPTPLSPAPAPTRECIFVPKKPPCVSPNGADEEDMGQLINRQRPVIECAPH